MSKVFEYPNGKLYLGDCNEILQDEAFPVIDLVLTDPPYLLTDLKFDKVAFAWLWLDLLTQRVQDNGYLCALAPFQMQAEIAKSWKWRFNGIWLKQSGIMRTASAKKPMGQQEMYGVYAHPKYRVSGLVWNAVKIRGYEPFIKKQHNSGYRRGGKDQIDRAATNAWTKEGYECINDGFRYATDVLCGNSKSALPIWERTEHPTQKPLSVLKILVQWLTNKDMVVCDPFMGSGSSVLAADQLGRRWIGIEKDEVYFDMARKRVEMYLENKTKDLFYNV